MCYIKHMPNPIDVHVRSENCVILSVFDPSASDPMLAVGSGSEMQLLARQFCYDSLVNSDFAGSTAGLVLQFPVTSDLIAEAVARGASVIYSGRGLDHQEQELHNLGFLYNKTLSVWERRSP